MAAGDLPRRANRVNFFGCLSLAPPEVLRNRVRLKSNLLNRFNVIWVVQLYREKYFALRLPQISSILSLSHPSEGRLENVTDAGWDAVDAMATQDGRR
jgi:hypothetical protein